MNITEKVQRTLDKHDKTQQVSKSQFQELSDRYEKEYQEEKGNLPEDIKQDIHNIAEQYQNFKEAALYRIYKQFDFSRPLVSEFLNVNLQNQQQQQDDWIEVTVRSKHSLLDRDYMKIVNQKKINREYSLDDHKHKGKEERRTKSANRNFRKLPYREKELDNQNQDRRKPRSRPQNRVIYVQKEPPQQQTLYVEKKPQQETRGRTYIEYVPKISAHTPSNHLTSREIYQVKKSKSENKNESINQNQPEINTDIKLEPTKNEIKTDPIIAEVIKSEPPKVDPTKNDLNKNEVQKSQSQPQNQQQEQQPIQQYQMFDQMKLKQQQQQQKFVEPKNLPKQEEKKTQIQQEKLIEKEEISQQSPKNLQTKDDSKELVAPPMIIQRQSSQQKTQQQQQSNTSVQMSPQQVKNSPLLTSNQMQNLSQPLVFPQTNSPSQNLNVQQQQQLNIPPQQNIPSIPQSFPQQQLPQQTFQPQQNIPSIPQSFPQQQIPQQTFQPQQNIPSIPQSFPQQQLPQQTFQPQNQQQQQFQQSVPNPLSYPPQGMYYQPFIQQVPYQQFFAPQQFNPLQQQLLLQSQFMQAKFASENQFNPQAQGQQQPQMAQQQQPQQMFDQSQIYPQMMNTGFVNPIDPNQQFAMNSFQFVPYQQQLYQNPFQSNYMGAGDQMFIPNQMQQLKQQVQTQQVNQQQSQLNASPMQMSHQQTQQIHYQNKVPTFSNSQKGQTQTLGQTQSQETKINDLQQQQPMNPYGQFMYQPNTMPVPFGMQLNYNALMSYCNSGQTIGLFGEIGTDQKRPE